MAKKKQKKKDFNMEKLESVMRADEEINRAIYDSGLSFMEAIGLLEQIKKNMMDSAKELSINYEVNDGEIKKRKPEVPDYLG